MSSPSEIKNLVNKIIKARKIQKERIEGSQAFQLAEQESLSKMQKPIISAVQAVQKEAQETVRALENQQVRLAQIESIAQPVAGPPPVQEPVKASFQKEGKWVQRLYKQFTDKTNRTNCEIDSRGLIGNSGYIDIDLLFNENSIKFFWGDQHSRFVAEKHVTPGLVCMLLIPYKALDKAKVRVDMQDVYNYQTLMTLAGFKPSTGEKYKTFLQKIQEENLNYNMFTEPMDFDDTRDSMDVSLFESPEKPPQEAEKSYYLSSFFSKTGKGVFAYKNPKEIEERLQVVLGSMTAGNNSKELKGEARSLLDELLEIKQILPNIHKRFYQKFNL